MYIPYKSAHPRQTIKNYVIGELKRYVRINTEELNLQSVNYEGGHRSQHP